MIGKLIGFTRALLRDKRMRYLIVGGINTVFGYGVSLALYYSLSTWLHIVTIGLIANVIAITFSFTTYKLLVFKTVGHWLREYFRCYIVYGGSALIGIASMWALVDVADVPYWLAQGLVIIFVAIVSYFAHSRFSFASKKNSTLTVHAESHNSATD